MSDVRRESLPCPFPSSSLGRASNAASSWGDVVWWNSLRGPGSRTETDIEKRVSDSGHEYDCGMRSGRLMVLAQRSAHGSHSRRPKAAFPGMPGCLVHAVIHADHHKALRAYLTAFCPPGDRGEHGPPWPPAVDPRRMGWSNHSVHPSIANVCPWAMRGQYPGEEVQWALAVLQRGAPLLQRGASPPRTRLDSEGQNGP